MRVWDLNPGYLSRKRLLGQHVEIHGIWSVITGGKQGYSQHPETKRWMGQLGWLARVHDLTVAEMKLRGFNHKSPLEGDRSGAKGLIYIDSPLRQIFLLWEKQRDDGNQRIPFPNDIKEFWLHHEYALLARGQEDYTCLEKEVEQGEDWDTDLMEKIISSLRTIPSEMGLKAAMEKLAAKHGIQLRGSLKDYALELFSHGKEDEGLAKHSIYNEVLGGD